MPLFARPFMAFPRGPSWCRTLPPPVKKKMHANPEVIQRQLRRRYGRSKTTVGKSNEKGYGSKVVRIGCWQLLAGLRCHEVVLSCRMQVWTFNSTPPTSCSDHSTTWSKRNAPEALFAVGDTSILQAGPRVAIVGSRKATPQGIARTQRLVKLLLERTNAVIVTWTSRRDRYGSSYGGDRNMVDGPSRSLAHHSTNPILEKTLSFKSVFSVSICASHNLRLARRQALGRFRCGI